jgi:1,4-alpha-glucan branching enzyme
MYSLNERYILPLSHDEVVHVKGSIVNKMPGCIEDKLSGERLLLGFMYAHPGKKLNFMGYEVAQFREWDYRSGIDFHLLNDEKHKKLNLFVKYLNNIYINTTQLFQVENDWQGFEWLVVDDCTNNVISFNRYDKDGNCLMCICNFSGIEQPNYTIGQHEGKYKVLLNSDDKKFGGSGTLKKRVFLTGKKHSHGKEYSLTLDIPKLACVYLIKTI